MPASWRRPLRLAGVGAVLILPACGGAGSPAATPGGDQLVIVTATPGTPRPAAPSPASGQRYLVREGDTLSAIALRFDVSEEAIQEANGLDNPDSLFAGQELTIPPPEP
jgi:LysM repeat protein